MIEEVNLKLCLVPKLMNSRESRFGAYNNPYLVMHIWISYDLKEAKERCIKERCIETMVESNLDFQDGSGFAGPIVLYFSYGLLDAMYQSTVYWTIGALDDDSEILSRYARFYKGVQSAVAAVAWQIDTHKVSFLTQLAIIWGLMTISYPLLALLIILELQLGPHMFGKFEKPYVWKVYFVFTGC